MEDAASSVVGVKTVNISDAWLQNVSEGRSVFESVYSWLRSEHGVEETRRDLHARTFAGKNLMKRLLAAETRRIKRRHGFSGDKLKRAVSWSNMDSGPMESWEGRTLVGDALFVVPPDVDLNGDAVSKK